MIGNRKLSRTLLRWDFSLTILVLCLPFVLTSVLGCLWLYQHGFFLYFVAICALVGILLFAVLRFTRYRVGAKQSETNDTDEFSVQANADWLPQEKKVFAEVCRLIETMTQEAHDWEKLPDLSLKVINEVARKLGDNKKGALNFTIPEALLLIEQTASRYRAHLRVLVPFSDQVSLRTMEWLWRQRHRATVLWKLASGSLRVARLATNAPVGVAREIERLIAGGNSKYLSEQMVSVMQGVLLEEVCFSAIELYSGRLQFSDSELLQIELGTVAADRARVPTSENPLRILVVGQISSGKSSLINGLLGYLGAETDTAPTTQGLVTYQSTVGEIHCDFIDSQGFDGSKARSSALLEEMTQADLIIWAIKANRPARAPDLALKQSFDAWFEEHAERRRPLVITVATFVDRLVDGWPYPEHFLPDDVQQKIAEVVNAISDDMEGLKPRPVSSISPEWNLDSINSAIGSSIGEALMVQRNRQRVEASRPKGKFVDNAMRGGRGVVRGSKVLGGRIVSKTLLGNRDDADTSDK